MQCKATTAGGQSCKMKALRGRRYCFTHDPQNARDRAKARKRGGERNRTPHAGKSDDLPRQVRTLDDANRILVYVLDEVIPMENSIPRARVLLSLFDSFVKALEIGELEQRITALETMKK